MRSTSPGGVRTVSIGTRSPHLSSMEITVCLDSAHRRNGTSRGDSHDADILGTRGKCKKHHHSQRSNVRPGPRGRLGYVRGYLDPYRSSVAYISFTETAAADSAQRNRHVAGHLNDRALRTLLLDLLTKEEQDLDEGTMQFRFDIPLFARRSTL